MEDTMPDWCSLPEDLLAMIAERLPTQFDIQRFRAVCRAFRISSVSSSFSQYPDLDIEYYPPNSLDYYKLHLAITECTVYAVEPLSEISNLPQSVEKLLMRVDKSSSGKLRIYQLLEDLPPLNLLDYRGQEISKGYSAYLVTESRLYAPVCISSDDKCALLAVIDDKVVAWKGGNKKGTEIDIGHDGPCGYILDIIYHNKKFYIYTIDKRVVTVDPKSLKVTELVVPLPLPPEKMSEFWVSLSNDLFCFGEGCLVFKLDEEKLEWIRVKGGWEDRAMFLWDECSFFLSTQEFFGFKNSSIRLIEFNSCTNAHVDGSISNIDLRDGTSERVYSRPVPDKAKRCFFYQISKH